MLCLAAWWTDWGAYFLVNLTLDRQSETLNLKLFCTRTCYTVQCSKVDDSNVVSGKMRR